MKNQILSLLLLTSLSQAENFYLGYDYLKVNYDESGKLRVKNLENLKT